MNINDSMEAQKDDAAYVFRGHRRNKRRETMYCSMSKNGQLAATGNLQSKVLLWNVVTGEIIMECKGFRDEVCFVGFNYNDTYLGVADERGKIKVWQINTKSCVWSTKIQGISEVEWCKFSNDLLAHEPTGILHMFEVPCNCEVPCKAFIERCGDPVVSFVILPDGQRAAIGFESGLISVVDMRTGTVLCSTLNDPRRLHGHQYAVSAIDCHPTNNMIISGSLTGQVILSCANSGKIFSLYDPKLPVKAGDIDKVYVKFVAFSRNPSLHVAAVALTLDAHSSDTKLLIWDIRNMKFTHQLGRYPISEIAWTSTGVLFAAGLADGVLRSYDARAGKCLRVFKGHIGEMHGLSICENEKKALTVSSDCTARIFDISSVSTDPY